jgi:hypothetical protein
MNLPIDIKHGSTPRIFVWRQVADTPIGQRTLIHEGALPPSVEDAVSVLIQLYKQCNSNCMRLGSENETLKAEIIQMRKKFELATAQLERAKAK